MPSTTPSPPVVPAVERTRFPWLPMLVLALGVAITVTAESMPAGLMPVMAESLGTDALSVGMLVSVWGLTIIITSIPLSRLTSAVDRKRIVVGSLAVLAVANLITAVAPSYEIALASRVLAAVAHGLFWSIVMVYATALLTDRNLGRGLSIVSGGVTIATVLAVPAGVALAQLVDWRAAFAAISAVMIVVAALVAVAMPSSREASKTTADAAKTPLMHDRTLLPVLAIGGTAVTFALGHFAMYTYVTQYFDRAAGFAPSWTGPLLAAFGITGALGLAASGFAVDRWPRASLPVTLALFAASMIALVAGAAVAGVVVAAIAVWGFAIGALSPLVQTLLMRTASERLRPVASAALIVFFNIGISAGALLGGIVEQATSPLGNAAFAALGAAASVAFVLLAVKLANGRRIGP